MVCRRKTGCARIVSGDSPQKKELRKQFLLSGLYEFLPAFGTGDRDLSLAFGYSHLLVAPWAIIITVILVFYLLEKEEKLSVFLIELINISGKGAEDGDEHESIGNSGAHKLDSSAGNQRCQQRKGQACAEDSHIQFVGAVAAFHKTPQTHTNFIAYVSQPVSESVHTLLLGIKSFLYYILKI